MKWAKRKALKRLIYAFERRYQYMTSEGHKLHQKLSRPFQKLLYPTLERKAFKIAQIKNYFKDTGLEKKYIPYINRLAVLENIKNLALAD
jgi:hypothetical protein